MSNENDLLEAQQKEKQKLAGVHYIDTECESVSNGIYCPKFVISTNDKTEFVTLTFMPISGAPNTILITKKEYAKLTMGLMSFLNAFMHDADGKPLIKG